MPSSKDKTHGLKVTFTGSASKRDARSNPQRLD